MTLWGAVAVFLGGLLVGTMAFVALIIWSDENDQRFRR